MYLAKPILHADRPKAIYYLPILISIKILWTKDQKRQKTAFVVHFTDRAKPKYPLKKPFPFSHFPQPNSTQTGLELNPDFQGERLATGHTNHGTLVICVRVCVCVCVLACARERERESEN